MMIAVAVAVAAFIFGVSRWATAPEWVPAFTNQPMETVGKMTEKLQAAGIQYKLERGGADILVAANDVARARVTLAKDGLPASGRPGLELFDQPSWGMTDFTQRINYRRAMEGELERTIGKMRGVQGVQVHLALHEQSNFRQQDKPSNASVVLKTDGEGPGPEVVQGIAHLVASSVDGITSERVSVLDDSGRLLTQPNDDGSMAGLTSTQLSTQREVENFLQTKAEGMVGDIVGAGNARVRVTAALNFDKIERQSELVDPDKQATSTEQKYEITPGAQGGAASSNVATSYDNSKVTESFTGAVGNIKRLSVAVLVNDRVIPPTLTGDPAKDKDLKPTYVARTPEEVARIESLVRSAVGADSTRGDIVTVVATRLSTDAAIVPEEAAKPDIWARAQQVEKPGIALLSIVALLVIAMMTLKALKTPAPMARAHNGSLALSSGSQDAYAPMLTSGGTAQSQMSAYTPIEFPGHSDARGKVIATVAAKPEVSARVVRAWMKES